MPEEAALIFADLAAPTLPELRARPVGKKRSTDRSALHDDITVVCLEDPPPRSSHACMWFTCLRSRFNGGVLSHPSLGRVCRWWFR